MVNKLQNNSNTNTPGAGESTWANEQFIVVANVGTNDDDKDHIISVNPNAGPGNGQFAINTHDPDTQDTDTDVICFVVYG